MWFDRVYVRPEFRYLVSGGTAALVHFAILTALVEWFSTQPLVATSIGFVIGSLVNYMLQYHWTFEADGQHHIILSRYTAVTIMTMSINSALFWTFTEQFQLYYLLAQLIATCMMVVVNFVINKHYTFVSH